MQLLKYQPLSKLAATMLTSKFTIGIYNILQVTLLLLYKYSKIAPAGQCEYLHKMTNKELWVMLACFTY